VAIASAVAAPAALAQAASDGPTPAQIRTAIQRAESSTALWATVNICDSPHYPNTMGVRAQMPGLGFAAWLSMDVQVNYYSQTQQRFLPNPYATKLIRLGRVTTTSLEQGGVKFAFPAGSSPLNATVHFRWMRSGRLLGETRRQTTAGHPGADFGSPPRFSAKQCVIP
jgi:hypothetical protein